MIPITKWFFFFLALFFLETGVCAQAVLPAAGLTGDCGQGSFFKAEQVTLLEIQKRLRLVRQWYKNNVVGGEVNYLYDPQNRQYNNEARTLVCSTMAVWVLNQLANHLNDARLNELGRQTTQYYLEQFLNITKSLEAGRLMPSKRSTKRGEVVKNRYPMAAFLALSLLEQGGYAHNQKTIDLIMEWLSGFQRPDGKIWTQLSASQYYDVGQVLLAFATVYRQSGNRQYRDFFDKSFEFYGPLFNEVMDQGISRKVPVSPAWLTLPVAKRYESSPDRKYVDLIFSINDRVVRWYEANTLKRPDDLYDGILMQRPDANGNVAVTASALESLVEAAHMAKIVGDGERLAIYVKVIKHTVAYLFRLQYTPENTRGIPDSHRVMGGFKTDLVNNQVWMDNVWHVTDALIRIERYGLL